MTPQQTAEFTKAFNRLHAPSSWGRPAEVSVIASVETRKGLLVTFQTDPSTPHTVFRTGVQLPSGLIDFELDFDRDITAAMKRHVGVFASIENTQ